MLLLQRFGIVQLYSQAASFAWRRHGLYLLLTFIDNIHCLYLLHYLHLLHCLHLTFRLTGYIYYLYLLLKFITYIYCLNLLLTSIAYIYCLHVLLTFVAYIYYLRFLPTCNRARKHYGFHTIYFSNLLHCSYIALFKLYVAYLHYLGITLRTCNMEIAYQLHYLFVNTIALLA